MTSTLCPTCSCRIPPHAPEGLCPRCLVSAGLVGSLGTQPAAQAAELLSVEELGELLPHREVEALIGRGGMGAVYLARDPRLGRRLAIKVLSGELAADPAFVERFAREARAVARLEHPNVVQIHQFVDDPDLPYLELEYVSGQNLRELLRAGPLRLDRAREILRQVAVGLAYAHREGVVHRDVKPENVLVDEDGRVRLVDFGLAKLTSDTRSLTLTGAQQVVGTVHYMAPEQLESPETVDARSDVYSWGVIAYEVLAGRLPLGRFGPPSRYAEVGPELDAIVLKALEREPEDRFADAGQLRARLEGAVAPAESVLPAGHEPERGSAPLAWGLIALALVVAFGVFVVAVVIVFLLLVPSQPERVPPPNPKPRLGLPLPTPRASRAQDPSAQPSPREEARLKALEAGARLQSRIAAAQSEVALSHERLARQDGSGAYASAEKALQILAEGDADLALLRQDPEAEAALVRGERDLVELRLAARCARVKAAVTTPSRARVSQAEQDVKALVEGRSRELCNSRVLEAAGLLRLLLGKPIAAGEDFRVWRERDPKSVAAAVGEARARLASCEPREALRLAEEAWSGSEHPLAPQLCEVALEAAIESQRSQDRDRWLNRLPRSERFADLLRARALSSAGDLFGALDELRAAGTRSGNDAAAEAEIRGLAAEIFLAHGLPERVRAEAAYLRTLPGQSLLAELWEGLAGAAECLPQARASLSRFLSKASPWEWREQGAALRALALSSFEEGHLGDARKFAKRALELNEWDRASLECLVRIEVDPFFDGQYLDDALGLCKRARQHETPRLAGLRALILSQQFPHDPGRFQRVAREAPLRTATPLLLDLRDRGSEGASSAIAMARLWERERDVSHPAGRACAQGLRFEHDSREAGREELTRSLSAQGRAARFYRRAIWHYPFHLQAQLGLARVALAGGSPRSAVAWAKRALQQHPQAPAAARLVTLLADYAPNSTPLRDPQVIPEAFRDAPDLVAGREAAAAWTRALEASPKDALAILEALPQSTSGLGRSRASTKASLLRSYAERVEAREPDVAKLARASAERALGEARAASEVLHKRLQVLLNAVRRGLVNDDLESALGKAREACLLAPDQGPVWAAYAEVVRRMRRPREALRASACAAWNSDEFLPLFLLHVQAAERLPRGPFLEAPPPPTGPGVRAFLGAINLTLGGASNSSLTAKLGRELEQLERLYPSKLAIPSLLGFQLSERGHPERALNPLLFADQVHPDLPPLPALAAIAAGGIESELQQPWADTQAILALRRAKALGVTWKEDLIPQRLRRQERLWAWLERPFDLSK